VIVTTKKRSNPYRGFIDANDNIALVAGDTIMLQPPTEDSLVLTVLLLSPVDKRVCEVVFCTPPPLGREETIF
jgi:hypothetical protein